MKNLKLFAFAVAFVLLCASNVFAQTEKGKIVLSGGTGLQFSSSTVKEVYDGESDGETKMSTLSFIPSFGYFVIDNLAIGLNGSFTSITYKDDSGNKYITSTSTFMPTASLYFPMDGKIIPFVQVGVGLASNSEKDVPKSGSDDKYTSSGLAFNLGGGLAFFLNDNLSVNFGLSYSKISLTDGDDDKYKIKTGTIGSTIGLAVYF